MTATSRFATLAALLAAIAASVSLLIAPSQTRISHTVIEDGTMTATHEQLPLLQSQGPAAAIPLAIPPALCLTALLARSRRTKIVCAAALTTLTGLAVASIGAFYLPAAAVLTIAAVTGPPLHPNATLARSGATPP